MNIDQNNITLHSIISTLDAGVARYKEHPGVDGLPLDLFHFISRCTPIVNVDLLIKDEMGRILLAWRDDGFAGSGWHVPGGIIRFKETIEDRIKKVSLIEIGLEVDFDPNPLAFNEEILDHDTRGHFISFIHECFLFSEFIPGNAGLKPTDPGYLKWHDKCPENLIDVHEIYREFINANR